MQLNEEACPVPESVLGQLYRASPHGLNAMIKTVSPQSRAMLAVYCYRRAHLASVGLAIAASCDEADLAWHGGRLGTNLFALSRMPDVIDKQSSHLRRRKVTLSGGLGRPLAPFVNDANLSGDAGV